MPEMKVEIDLNDILGDKYGAETLQESVRRQVIESLTNTIKEGVGKQIDTEVSRILNDEIRTAVKSRMDEIVADLLNAEYVTCDRYGDRSRTPTTFRKELVKAIHEQMAYKKADSDWHKNAFTKAVDDVISDNVSQFKAEFSKKVDAQFVADCMKHAATKLQERLGVKAS